VAPPTLLVAVAIGLGTIDMPVPSVEEWEWLNWKFPRPVHAGDTIYARWTLTQKRPPVGGAPTSIVVWRVDLHTADGALCAEGEVGAKVRRLVVSRDLRSQEPAASTAPRRRRGRRRPALAANGPVPETPAIAAPPAPVAKPERAAGPARRRRRRRPSSGSSTPSGEPAGNPAPPPAPAVAPPPPAQPALPRPSGGLGSVIRRLRRT
jgi:hypothetical protein